MERLPLLFGLFVIGLFSQSCQKEDVDIDIKSNDWQVIEVEWDDQSTSEGTDSLYIIQFQSDTTVLLIKEKVILNLNKVDVRKFVVIQNMPQHYRYCYQK